MVLPASTIHGVCCRHMFSTCLAGIACRAQMSCEVKIRKGLTARLIIATIDGPEAVHWWFGRLAQEALRPEALAAKHTARIKA